MTTPSQKVEYPDMSIEDIQELCRFVDSAKSNIINEKKQRLKSLFIELMTKRSISVLRSDALWLSQQLNALDVKMITDTTTNTTFHNCFSISTTDGKNLFYRISSGDDNRNLLVDY